MFARFGYALLCLIVAAPMLVIAASWLMPSDRGLAYFLETGLLATYALNSLWIALGCGGLAFIIGTAAAWATTMLAFPGRAVLSWLLILPLAVPGYIAALIYAYLLDVAGPVQSAWRAWSGLSAGEAGFPPIRSLGGVIFILTITLYPYVYLLAKSAFLTLSLQMMDTGRVLGHGRWSLFFRLVLPMARPMLAVGVALVMMEALADYGVVSLYGVPAFTTGITRAWSSLYDPVAAVQMASLLLVLVVGLLTFERLQRGRAAYMNSTGLYQPLPRHSLSGALGWGVSALCAVPVVLGAGIPLAALGAMSYAQSAAFSDTATWQALGHSLQVALATALAAGLIGLLLAYRLRYAGDRLNRALTRLATSGYAIPGAVVAVGLMLLFTWGTPWLITGSLIGIIWACTFRFLTISFHSIEAGLQRITPSMDAVAATLGAGRASIGRRIHWPILAPSLLAAMLLVFVDTLKELPATLLLRPFNFETLAIRTHELAGDELLVRAAPTALILVLISLAPVWLISRRMRAVRQEETA